MAGPCLLHGKGIHTYVSGPRAGQRRTRFVTEPITCTQAFLFRKCTGTAWKSSKRLLSARGALVLQRKLEETRAETRKQTRIVS